MKANDDICNTMNATEQKVCKDAYAPIYVGGALREIYKELAKRAGVTFNFKWGTGAVSEGNKIYNSSWTAAVADVRDGLTDMCISEFWETDTRRDLRDLTRFDSL
jgi:hypothetical protein